MSALKKIENIVVGVIGIALVSRLILPGNHTAEMISAMAKGQEQMIRVAFGERIITTRDIPRFETLLGTIDDPTMTELFAGLSDADLDWVERMLSDA